MQKQSLQGHARISFKQSFKRLDYLLFVFFKLSHYCKSYPKLGYTKLNNKYFPFLTFTSRSLMCFTEIYNIFYPVPAACGFRHRFKKSYAFFLGLII